MLHPSNVGTWEEQAYGEPMNPGTPKANRSVASRRWQICETVMDVIDYYARYTRYTLLIIEWSSSDNFLL